jgi:hypothetical protein
MPAKLMLGQSRVEYGQQVPLHTPASNVGAAGETKDAYPVVSGV